MTNIELFFDLVFVFSIIQLSQFLLEYQTWTRAVEAITIFAALWWAWNYTAWASNWINPEHNLRRAGLACAVLRVRMAGGHMAGYMVAQELPVLIAIFIARKAGR